MVYEVGFFLESDSCIVCPKTKLSSRPDLSAPEGSDDLSSISMAYLPAYHFVHGEAR